MGREGVAMAIYGRLSALNRHLINYSTFKNIIVITIWSGWNKSETETQTTSKKATLIGRKIIDAIMQSTQRSSITHSVSQLNCV